MSCASVWLIIVLVQGFPCFYQVFCWVPGAPAPLSCSKAIRIYVLVCSTVQKWSYFHPAVGHKSCSATDAYFHLSRPGQYPSTMSECYHGKHQQGYINIYKCILLNLQSVSIIRVPLHQFLAMCWSSHGSCSLSYNTCQWWDSHCTCLLFCNFLVWGSHAPCSWKWFQYLHL